MGGGGTPMPLSTAPTITDEDVQAQRALVAAALRRKRTWKSLKYEPSRTLLGLGKGAKTAAQAAMRTGGTLLGGEGGGSGGEGGGFGGGEGGGLSPGSAAEGTATV